MDMMQCIAKRSMTLDEAKDELEKFVKLKTTMRPVFVDVLTSADVAEVKHGRWEDGKRMGFDGTFHWFRQCSECLYEREDDNEDKDTPYCPNCGARMDEVEE